ncbi:conjugative transposon protein TraM [Aureibaculum algae]|uniref:Conjugative transposon protein TraM n=1 Tax=Aureibaculum algae TaxID=2584122 RepID=A0A5B7TL72_9FLAO|nr:conjugative transposon protein TraM [Aureibaculum algae]QCX37389.1 conjugative transposon protein TraM [Aureibaculum algae]
MKIQKKKIVFILILISVLLYIVASSISLFNKNEDMVIENNEVPVPELKDEQKQYKSKLDALNDLKEVRQTNAPSIYDERLLDSTGTYDPYLLDKDKQRIIDSIYRNGQIQYSQERTTKIQTINKTVGRTKDSLKQIQAVYVSAKRMGSEHEQFFKSVPSKNENSKKKVNTDKAIYVEVDGNQVVKKNYRLRMRLTKGAIINDKLIPKNTLIYGFIKFQPNRAMIEIENFNHIPTKLKAFDLQDGSEGIYVENSFRGEIAKEVAGELIDEVNIPGVPQLGGVTKVFQRHNRKIKVTIINNYKLILKPR